MLSLRVLFSAAFISSMFALNGTVCGSGWVNVAMHKPTRQSSNFRDEKYGSENVVDGNSSAFITTCSHTKNNRPQWWIVDLLQSYRFTFINITNRDIQHERLGNFSIYASRYNPMSNILAQAEMIGQLCWEETSNLPVGGPHTIHCYTAVTARYVYLHKANNRPPLTICEFEVMVSKADLELKQNYFRLQPDARVSTSPFHAEVLQVPSPSPRLCAWVCLSTGGGVANLIQVHLLTGRCECVQQTGLSTWEAVPTAGWTLMEEIGGGGGREEEEG